MHEHSSTRKIAFVTGAGSGIGEANALRFLPKRAPRWWRRRIEPLQGVQENRLGGKADIAVADVSNEQVLVEALQVTAQRHGRPDILVNNAMAYTWGGIEAMTTADWHANFTTTDGTFGAPTMQLMKAQGAARSSISPLLAACLARRGWLAIRRPRRR